jgi:predicted unusual protein kinase regulating ubiquinone biosynthesis (AarF/ABC1/UbiB family)
VANTAVQATEKAITALANVNLPPQVKMPAIMGELEHTLAGVYAAHPVWTMAGAFVVVLAFVAASGALPKKTTTPYPTGTYNFKSAELYFAERPATVVQRAAFISLSAAGWGLGVVIDVLTGSYKQNERRRADELTDLLTRLGPTFIKIGQSLSIRSDLLTPEYLRSLTSLQDKVPSFSTEIARQIISDELGKPCDSIFTGIDKPVAAASLGQVYKATLTDGRQVAVKVQRPQILEQIALDMHLIRITAPVIKALGAPGDVEGLVDDWGFGFVNEVDYLQEARNADVFMDGLKTTALAKVVFAPPVLRDLSSRRVLTTEWIDGERLEKSSAKDVSTLCSVAMNTYLTMMLETGTMQPMHCHAHLMPRAPHATRTL